MKTTMQRGTAVEIAAALEFHANAVRKTVKKYPGRASEDALQLAKAQMLDDCARALRLARTIEITDI